MYGRYEVDSVRDGASYQFISDSGNTYIAYFTEFILLDAKENDLPVLSFGLACQLKDHLKPQVRDLKIRNTVIHIINEVFSKQPDHVVLYICTNNDARGAIRHANFERWFDHAESSLERYDAPKTCEQNGFYSSMLLKPDHPQKSKYVAGFYFTISYYKLDQLIVESDGTNE